MDAARTLALILALAALGAGATATISNKDVSYRMVELKREKVQNSTVVPVMRAERRGVNPHIVDGEEAAQCQFPYQVALLTDRGSFCGGSLINSRWVLTAAHCVTSATYITVHLGSYEWYSAPHQIKSARIFLHGAYDADSLNYDIALLDLGQDVPTGDCLQPVEIERSGCGTSALDNIVADASGWGLTGDASSSVQSRLRWVKTRTITNAACEAEYNSNVVIQSTLCSLPVNNASPGTLCSGDSGGPLVDETTGRQIGINSFVSIAGCEVNKPSGYVRVPCFAAWIDYVTSL